MNLPRTIHAAFSAHAAACPDRIALAGGGDAWSYAELSARAARIAAYLHRHGVRQGDRVGLYAERSLHAVAAMLGILEAGAAYVPFDPAYPPKLLRFMYEDCAPVVMLAHCPASKAAPFWDGTAHSVTEAAAAAATHDPLRAAGSDVGPDDLAYIMYTSGSTGHPKGVRIPHRGVVRLVVDNPFATMGPDEVHLLLAPLAFDASTFEIWGALLNGAKLAVAVAPYPSLDDIAADIAHHGVTTLWLTAGVFHLMVDHRLSGLAPLKQLIAGGDVLSPSHVLKAQAALPRCQLINGYGPTENTTFTCCYRIPRDFGGGPLPIGMPIARTTVYIVDGGIRVREGEEGELYAAGEGVALGYLNRHDLTRQRFIPDPFDARGGRVYRTGDRVRRRADGNIEFLGRVDRQVKINGKRVELDDIEACLRRCPSVEGAAVIACPSTGASTAGASSAATPDAGLKKLHAYVTLRGAVPDAGAALRAFLKDEVPDHMIPSTFTVLEALPLSPTGKVDRSKLPSPPGNAARATATPAPAAPAPAPSPAASPAAAVRDLEQRLLEIWRTVLGTDAVGLQDNFFDLGGTSLQLLQVHATIAGDMNTDVTVVDLFEYPRISALAARLQRPRGAPPRGSSAAGVMDADERASRRRAALQRARANTGRVTP